MKTRKWIIGIAWALCGCGMLGQEPVKQKGDGYELQKNTSLEIVLKSSLGCNINKRGDTFSASLKKPYVWNQNVVLPSATQVRGLVQKVTRYQKFGDKASLVLEFDQIVLPDGREIPIAASLDTAKGSGSIRIKDKPLQDAKVIGTGAIVGALVGNAVLGEKGAEDGILIGATVGTGVVLLSNAREVKLPQGTEIAIKLDEPVLIPR